MNLSLSNFKFAHVFNVAILIFIGTIMPQSAHTQNANIPTPQILIESWQKLIDDLKSSVRSYRLEGSIEPAAYSDGRQTNSQNGIQASGSINSPPTYMKNWTAIDSGYKFFWEFETDRGSHKMACSGDEYDIYSKFPNASGIGIHNRLKAENINNYFIHVYAFRVPFRIEDILLHPSLVCSTAQNSERPLADFYRSQGQNLKVVGEERIDNWNSYHLQLIPGFKTSLTTFASDVWIAKIEGRFIPIQFDFSEGNSIRYVRLTFTKGQKLGSGWVPTEYKVYIYNHLKPPAGSADSPHPDVIQTCTLNMSEINTDFPQGTFRITFPANTEIVLYGDNLGVSKSPQIFGKSLLAGSAVKIVFIIVIAASIFIFYLSRAKGQKNA